MESKTLSLSSGSGLLFIIVLLLSYTLTVQQRYAQFQHWQAQPEVFFVEGSPLVTTADAPYYLRLAREFAEDKFKPGGLDRKREYPVGKRAPDRIPLLSFLLAKLSPLFEGNLYLTGHWMVILGAGLFVIPLGLYGWQIGYPIAGLLAGIVGGFSFKYFARTSIGRIDTDMLNLFFPVLAAYFALLACQAKKTYWGWSWAALSGITMYLFTWWYDRPAFLLPWFLALLIGLVIWKQRTRITLPALVIYLLCIGPGAFFQSWSKMTEVLGIYFKIGLIREAFAQAPGEGGFPIFYNWVAESRAVEPLVSLGTLLNEPLLSLAGLLAFAYFLLKDWRKFLLLSPVFFLGLLGFVSSQRFVFYLTPFLGFGFGLVLQQVLELGWTKIQQYSKSQTSILFRLFPSSTHYRYQSFQYLGLLIVSMALLSETAWGYVPKPTFPAQVFRGFQDLKTKTPEDAVIYTWWDMGLALLEQAERAVIHDGGTQARPKTYLIARSLISSEQSTLKDTMGFLARQNDIQILRLAKQKKLFTTINSGKHKVRHPSYVLLTNDMILSFPTFYSIGSWDLSNQQYRVSDYTSLKCDHLENLVLNCQKLTFDLKDGWLNDKIPLKRVVQSLRGNQIVSQEFHPRGLTLQFMMSDERVFQEIYLLEEEVWQSNFNQMFLLGNYDQNIFEETMHSYPWMRLFQLK